MENLISFGSKHQNQAVSKSTFIVWTRDVIINVEWIQFLVVMPLPWQKCRDVLTRFENAQKVQQLRSACERLQFWKCQRTQSLKYSISMETISEKIRNQHRNVVKCNIPKKNKWCENCMFTILTKIQRWCVFTGRPLTDKGKQVEADIWWALAYLYF